MRSNLSIFNVTRNLHFLFRFYLFSIFRSNFFRLFRLGTSVIFVLATLFDLYSRVVRFLYRLFVEGMCQLVDQRYLLILYRSIRGIRLGPFLIRRRILILTICIGRFLTRRFRLYRQDQHVISRDATFSIDQRFATGSAFIQFRFSIVLLGRQFRTMINGPRDHLRSTLKDPLLSKFRINALSWRRSSDPWSGELSNANLTNGRQGAEHGIGIRLVGRNMILCGSEL